jgi:predicted nucleic acid-binding protein
VEEEGGESMTRIYLDVCCLNRPFDDQTQDRIRLESEAVLLILKHIETMEWEWVGSEVLEFEIDQTPDPERRHRVQIIARFVHRSVLVSQSEIERARELEALGFDGYDALHLACSESGEADVFLTTDDKLLRLASRYSGQLQIRVVNPLRWLEEVT